MTTPFQILIMMFVGWVNEHQRTVVAYLQEENRVLRELHGKKGQRVQQRPTETAGGEGQALGRRVLREIGTLVSPDTILRWHRELIARTYDGSEGRRPGRPAAPREIRDLVVRMETENAGFLNRTRSPKPAPSTSRRSGGAASAGGTSTGPDGSAGSIRSSSTWGPSSTPVGPSTHPHHRRR